MATHFPSSAARSVADHCSLIFLVIRERNLPVRRGFFVRRDRGGTWGTRADLSCSATAPHVHSGGEGRRAQRSLSNVRGEAGEAARVRRGRWEGVNVGGCGCMNVTRGGRCNEQQNSVSSIDWLALRGDESARRGVEEDGSLGYAARRRHNGQCGCDRCLATTL